MFSSLLPIILIQFFALISPDQNFWLIVNNTIGYNRKTGIWTMAGVITATIVHISYSLVAVGMIIAHSILLFTMIKVMGGIYLIYIILQTVRRNSTLSSDLETVDHHRSPTTHWHYWRQGFLTAISQTKEAPYYIAIFTLFTPNNASPYFLTLLGISAVVVSTLRFSLIIVTIRLPITRSLWTRFITGLSIVCGWLGEVLGLTTITIPKPSSPPKHGKN